MSPWRAGVFLFLGLAWISLPWPLARWACLTVGLFLALGALWSWVVSRSLRVSSPDAVLRTFSGRKLEVVTRVENRSPLPTGLLFLGDSSGGLETWGPTRRYTRLPPFSLLRLSFTVRGRERGTRHLGPLVLKGADPTGLFPFVREAVSRQLIVYPPVKPVRGWPGGGLPPGNRRWETAAVDDPSRLRAFREFQVGDPLNRVSAAVWARFGTPMVRTYDRTVSRPTGVVVDLRAAGYPLKLRWALIESAVETAASLVWDLLARGESVWLTVADASPLPPTSGPARGWTQARPFLERLALAVSDRAEVPGPLPVLPPPPLRLLWVGPGAAGAEVGGRGYEVVRFPVTEEGGLGFVIHP